MVENDHSMNGERAINERPRWAPRVPQHKIRRLYEMDAQGIKDDLLIDDVGIGLYLRCQSILTVNDIWINSQLPCPHCGQVISHFNHDWGDADYSLHCSYCSWQMRWGDYHATFRHQELVGGGMLDYCQEYVQKWETARTPKAKILIIDQLIHRWHWETRHEQDPDRFGLGRPVGVNLIEGSRKAVIAFLDNLTYGEGSTEGTQETKEGWQTRWYDVKQSIASGSKKKF
jgi:hypothetical protein